MQWAGNCRKRHGAHKDGHFMFKAAMKRKYEYNICTNSTAKGQKVVIIDGTITKASLL